MKPIKIYLADWVFIEKKTGEDVIVEAIITPYIPLKFLVLDDYIVNRAIKAFGENRKTFLRTLEKNEDGSYKVKSVIYRKYINDSNVNYEIVNGMINYKLSEPAKEMLITGLIENGASEEEAAVFAGDIINEAEKRWMDREQEKQTSALLADKPKTTSWIQEQEEKHQIQRNKEANEFWAAGHNPTSVTEPLTNTPEWDNEF